MWSWLRAQLLSDDDAASATPAQADAEESACAGFDPDARLNYVRCLFRVDGQSPVPPSAAEAGCLEELQALIKRGEISDLVPRLSGTLPKLLASLRENPPAGVLAKQVAADPHLLAGVMSVANSPVFRTRRSRESEIEDIEHAVVMLGSRHLREVIASVTFRPILCVDSMSLVDSALARSMWEHAIECAGECRRLGSGTDGFAFYLCGMTQAVGLTAVLRYLFDRAPAIQGPLSATFAEEIARLYPKISSVLAREWALPAMTGDLLDGLAASSPPHELVGAVDRAILDYLTRAVAPPESVELQIAAG